MARRRFLDPAVSDGKAKNISLDHTSGKLQAHLADRRTTPRALAAMIERFGAGATRLVGELLPYRDVERARTSFRPVEVEGRAYSMISDDRLLHVDAFPVAADAAGPAHPALLLQCRAAGLRHGAANATGMSASPSRISRAHSCRAPRPHPPGKSWLWDRLGVTRGRRSAYDEMMLSLHDAAKRDDGFQATSPQTALDFPPGSCWLVYTDQVLHAALGGAFALEQTFHLDLAQMAEPERSPFRVLERLSGKTLA